MQATVAKIIFFESSIKFILLSEGEDLTAV